MLARSAALAVQRPLESDAKLDVSFEFGGGDGSLQHGSGIVCSADLNEVSSLLSAERRPEGCLFVATFSLCESPLARREAMVRLVRTFPYHLLAYQIALAAHLGDLNQAAWGLASSVRFAGGFVENSRHFIAQSGEAVEMTGELRTMTFLDCVWRVNHSVGGFRVYEILHCSRRAQ